MGPAQKRPRPAWAKKRDSKQKESSEHEDSVQSHQLSRPKRAKRESKNGLNDGLNDDSSFRPPTPGEKLFKSEQSPPLSDTLDDTQVKTAAKSTQNEILLGRLSKLHDAGNPGIAYGTSGPNHGGLHVNKDRLDGDDHQIVGGKSVEKGTVGDQQNAGRENVEDQVAEKENAKGQIAGKAIADTHIVKKEDVDAGIAEEENVKSSIVKIEIVQQIFREENVDNQIIKVEIGQTGGKENMADDIVKIEIDDEQNVGEENRDQQIAEKEIVGGTFMGKELEDGEITDGENEDADIETAN